MCECVGVNVRMYVVCVHVMFTRVCMGGAGSRGRSTCSLSESSDGKESSPEIAESPENVLILDDWLLRHAFFSRPRAAAATGKVP